MRNSSVITNESVRKHFVENYRFKVLGTEIRQAEPENEPLSDDEPTNKSEFVAEPPVYAQMPTQPPPPPQNSGFDASFVEELLKKTDELSTNIVKLQMQIENQEAEFNRRLEAQTSRAFEDGKSEGLNEASANFDAKIAELNERFNSSVAKISAKFDALDEFVAKNEDELAKTAINVAKQVIESEISQHSSKIAFNLAKMLLGEIKDAKDITLRVNPSDSEYLTQNFKGKNHIKIEADDAISKGGVVITSEAGNIDGTILSRFEKLTNLVG